MRLIFCRYYDGDRVLMRVRSSFSFVKGESEEKTAIVEDLYKRNPRKYNSNNLR